MYTVRIWQVAEALKRTAVGYYNVAEVERLSRLVESHNKDDKVQVNEEMYKKIQDMDIRVISG